jgi:hypothetical protein
MSKADEALLDLDAERAARAAARGKPPEIKLGEKIYVLPAELPFEFMENMLYAKREPHLLIEAVKLVFGDAFDEVRPKLSVSDMDILMDRVPLLYGMRLGESPASPPS